MKYFFYASLFLFFATLFSCEGNEQPEGQEEQIESVEQDSTRRSILDEAERVFEQGDTTILPVDSAGTIIK